MKRIIILLLVMASGVNVLIAGGYQVRLQGQKQTGIGLIGTPFAFGASSIFYNPGSLSFMKDNTSFSGGLSGILSTAVFRAKDSDYTTETDNPLGTPFYFYGATKVIDDVSVGLGVYTPFGNSIKWDEDWMGRYLVQDISLRAIFIQPTVSYKINDRIGLGAGLSFVMGNVELSKAIPAPVNGEFSMEGKSNALGYNLGLYVKATDKLNIGVDYRSKVKMKVEDGETQFSSIPSSLDEYFPSSGNFASELPLPANLDFGLSYQFTEKFMMAAELNIVFWSVYDSLIIDFEKNNEKLTDSRNPREYSNSFICRLGGEYKFGSKFIARAGVYYDPTPTNEDYFTPETVSLNQFGFTLGLSYMPVKGLSIDLSYLQLEGLEADKKYTPANFEGTYKTRAFIPGIGLSYSF